MRTLLEEMACVSQMGMMTIGASDHPAQVLALHFALLRHTGKIATTTVLTNAEKPPTDLMGPVFRIADQVTIGDR